MYLATRLVADIAAQAFKHDGEWRDDPALSAFLRDQTGQMREPIVFDGPRQQPCRQLGRRSRPEGTQPQPVLQLGGMASTVPLGGQEFVDCARKDLDLLGNKGKQRRRRTFTGAQRTTGMVQIAKDQRLTEAIVVAATPSVRHQVSVLRGDQGENARQSR